MIVPEFRSVSTVTYSCAIERRLIDCQVLNGSALSSGQPPLDRSLPRFQRESRGLIAGDLHLFRDSFDRRDFEPRDRHRFKQGDEPSAWLRPRDMGLANSEFRAVNPRDTGLEHGDIPTGIEVSPLSLAVIVGGAFLVTFWTSEPPQWLMGQFQRDLHLFHLEIHLLNAQTRQHFNKPLVLHERRSTIFPPIHPKPGSPDVNRILYVRSIDQMKKPARSNKIPKCRCPVLPCLELAKSINHYRFFQTVSPTPVL
jgi:hypothetical protein